MQGYKKNEEERKFATMVEQFLISRNLFFVKMYADEVNQFSNPDYIVCINGRFIAIELNNYLQGEKLSLSKDKIKKIMDSRGTLLLVEPSNFEMFKSIVLKDIEDNKPKFDAKRPMILGKYEPSKRDIKRMREQKKLRKFGNHSSRPNNRNFNSNNRFSANPGPNSRFSANPVPKFRNKDFFK